MPFRSHLRMTQSSTRNPSNVEGVSLPRLTISMPEPSPFLFDQACRSRRGYGVPGSTMSCRHAVIFAEHFHARAVRHPLLSRVHDFQILQSEIVGVAYQDRVQRRVRSLNTRFSACAVSADYDRTACLSLRPILPAVR